MTQSFQALIAVYSIKSTLWQSFTRLTIPIPIQPVRIPWLMRFKKPLSLCLSIEVAAILIPA